MHGCREEIDGRFCHVSRRPARIPAATRSGRQQSGAIRGKIAGFGRMFFRNGKNRRMPHLTICKGATIPVEWQAEWPSKSGPLHPEDGARCRFRT
jgi:hypothetical protein